MHSSNCYYNRILFTNINNYIIPSIYRTHGHQFCSIAEILEGTLYIYIYYFVRIEGDLIPYFMLSCVLHSTYFVIYHITVRWYNVLQSLLKSPSAEDAIAVCVCVCFAHVRGKANATRHYFFHRENVMPFVQNYVFDF